MFGNDVAGTFQSIFHILHIAFYIAGCTIFGMRFPLQHQQGGKWFQTLLPGCFRTGLALGFVGEVDIFQHGVVPGRFNALLELGCQFPLFRDGAEDGFFPFGCLIQLLILRLDSFNLYFVQAARHFFAVAADERDGCPVIQQAERLADLFF